MPDRSHATGFTQNTLDRKSAQREDPAFIAARLADASSRHLVLSGDVPALKPSRGSYDALFTRAEADRFGAALETVFLGCQRNEDGRESPLFARRIEVIHESPVTRDDLAFTDLRKIAAEGLLPPDLTGALAQAKSLLHWHQHNGFCSGCGAGTTASASGSRRECAQCGRQHFPRLDPVAIMLVTDGTSCLLGRQSRFGPGMYSCLAGFAEVGETLEDTVRREIMEEAGITVGRVDYLASQPWPFPASLMIGCIGQALSHDITIDAEEIEDARWFSKDDAKLMLARNHPGGLTCPPPLAIAHLLIKAWVAGET